MKLLYITPHLSTGGLPQYLLKKIEELKFIYDIYLVEYDCISYDYTVQRNKILNILGSKFYTLNSHKEVLIEIINSIKPDIIHLEEFPETFINDSITNQIYNPHRQYTIVETTHGSMFSSSSKRFLPDKFAFVSELNVNQFKDLGIPYDLVEYPIEVKERPDRTEALKELGLSPDLKHILNVGLFTPGKNQAEIFQYAKELVGTPLQFHFVGNQAQNFEDYWKPLLNNKPANCHIWGERNDIEKFYSAMDLFLFTSKLENNPLVIKEALSWEMPVLMRRLPNYGTKYDGNLLVNYLGDNDQINLKIIESYFSEIDWSMVAGPKIGLLKKVKHSEGDILVTFNQEDNKVTFQYNKSGEFEPIVLIKELNTNLVMYKFEPKFVNGNSWWAIPRVGLDGKFVDYELFGGLKIEFYSQDKELLFTKIIKTSTKEYFGTHYNVPELEFGTYVNFAEFFIKDLYKEFINGKKLDTVVDIGANYGIWADYILSKGAKNVYCVEPNATCNSTITEHFKDKQNVKIIKKGIYNKDGEIIFHINPNVSVIGSLVKYDTGGFQEEKIEVITLSTLFNTYNLTEVDLLKMDIEGAEYDIFDEVSVETLNKINNILLEWHYRTEIGNDRLNSVIIPKLKEAGFNIEFKNQDTLEVGNSDLEGGILFATRKKDIKKDLDIRVVHLLSEPWQPREIKSMKTVSLLLNLGVKYFPMVNPPFKGEVPKESCTHPEQVGVNIKEGHYGCYLAHKAGVVTDWNLADALLVFECDANITIPPKEFMEKVKLAYDIMEKNRDIILFSFGWHNNQNILEKFDDCWIVDKFYGAHAYLIPKWHKELFKNRYEKLSWNVGDLWYNESFPEYKFGIFETPITSQFEGVSIIDNIFQKERV